MSQTSMAAASLTLAASLRLFAGYPQIVTVKKIWDQAPHSASGDLIFYKGRWLCAFKEAQGHASHIIHKQDNGKLRVLESADGDSWKSAASIEEAGIDLRDPHFSVMPDGRLMMLAGGSSWAEDGKYIGRQTRVLFSGDGRAWSRPQPILAPGEWLWRVTWHNGRAWGVAYEGGGGGTAPFRGFLYAGSDGIHYERITELQVEGINETTVQFDGERMIAMVRRETGNQRGWIGTSAPPYKQWDWFETRYRFGGPNFLQIPGEGWWASSRFHLLDPPPGPGGVGKTVLAKMDARSYEPVLILPSGLDNAYAGMVWHDNMLWMIYYSSHEGGKASIYFAKVRF